MTRHLAAFVVVTSLLPLLTFAGDGGVLSSSTLVVAGFTLPASLVGVAVYRIWRRRGWLQWSHSALGGAALGVACALPFALSDLPLFVFLVPAFAAIGALHGLLFWIIALWRDAVTAGAHTGR